MARELFEFNSVDISSSWGRQPWHNQRYIYIPPYVDPMNTIPHPWVKWKDRGVVGLCSEEKNIIKSPALNHSTWTYTGGTVSPVYDEGMQRKVYSFSSGGSSTYERLTLSTGVGGHISLSLWVWCNQAFQVRGGYVDAMSTYYWDSWTIVPARTWTFIEHQQLNILASVGAVWEFSIGGGTIPSNIEWRACDPTIVTDPGIQTFSYPGTQANRLVFPITVPERFSFGFWFRPLYGYGYDSTPRIIGFERAATERWMLFFWGDSSDKIAMLWENAGTAAYIESQRFSDGGSYDDLNQWLYICGYSDVTQQNGSWLKVRTPTTNTKFSNWSGTPDYWDDNIGGFGVMCRSYSLDDTYNGRGLITDLMLAWDEEVTESEFDEHYLLNRPYCAKNRVLGKNCNWRLDEFGSLTVREITVG